MKCILNTEADIRWAEDKARREFDRRWARDKIELLDPFIENTVLSVLNPWEKFKMFIFSWRSCSEYHPVLYNKAMHRWSDDIDSFETFLDVIEVGDMKKVYNRLPFCEQMLLSMMIDDIDVAHRLEQKLKNHRENYHRGAIQPIILNDDEFNIINRVV